MIWTVHNVVSHESKFSRIEIWGQRLFLFLVDYLIVHNSSALSEVSNSYKVSPAKIFVIPHGNYRTVYPEAINRSQARKILNFPESGRIYLHFGLLRPYKGTEEMLKIWENNQRLFSKHTLAIVGKALDKKYGQKLSKESAQHSNVIFQNEFLEDEKIHLYFSAADVVVLPFQKVLTSGSLILAMSYGKPIIVPRLNSIMETLGTADALSYDPNDSLGLSHSFNDSLKIDLSELSRQVVRACDALSWETIGQKTYNVYRLAKYCRDTRKDRTLMKHSLSKTK